MRVLPYNFFAKKTTILEYNNLDDIQLLMLVGKLKTFEMELKIE